MEVSTVSRQIIHHIRDYSIAERGQADKRVSMGLINSCGSPGVPPVVPQITQRGSMAENTVFYLSITQPVCQFKCGVGVACTVEG